MSILAGSGSFGCAATDGNAQQPTMRNPRFFPSTAATIRIRNQPTYFMSSTYKVGTTVLKSYSNLSIKLIQFPQTLLDDIHWDSAQSTAHGISVHCSSPKEKAGSNYTHCTHTYPSHTTY
jgi:hypothetical protein